MNEPLRPQDPRVLGPFQIRARLAERDAGLVFAGEDAFGRDVAIAVLHPAAAADSAVRDRFGAAVRVLAEGGKVPASGVRAPVAWAAVASGAIKPSDGAEARAVADAVGVLDAVSLTSGDDRDGPTFVPHWADVPDKGWPQPDVPPPRSAGRGATLAPGLGIAALTVLLAVAVLYSLGLTEWGDGGRAASGDRAASGGGVRTSEPAETPSPTLRSGADGPVAGPTFGKGEDTYHMKLKGFPFEFDAPGTWGCMNSDEEPFDSRWICVDDGGEFGGAAGSGAGGMVAVRACPKPCGDGERATMRETLAVESGDWRGTDATTMYAEVEGEDEDGERVLRIAMSHVFGDGRRPDTEVAVVLTGPVDQKTAMQKLVNEIRERTP